MGRMMVDEHDQGFWEQLPGALEEIERKHESRRYNLKHHRKKVERWRKERAIRQMSAEKAKETTQKIENRYQRKKAMKEGGDE